MVDMFPALTDSTVGGSYTHRRSEMGLSNRLSNAVPGSECDFTSNIKRVQTLPRSHYTEQAIEKKIHGVKFSSSFTSHQSPSGRDVAPNRYVMS